MLVTNEIIANMKNIVMIATTGFFLSRCHNFDFRFVSFSDLILGRQNPAASFNRNDQYCRGPKIRVPTRTRLAPSSTATGQSPLMPIKRVETRAARERCRRG